MDLSSFSSWNNKTKESVVSSITSVITYKQNDRPMTGSLLIKANNNKKILIIRPYKVSFWDLTIVTVRRS